MNIFVVTQGRDSYEWDKNPGNSLTRYDIDDIYVSDVLQTLNSQVKDELVLWYFATLQTFNPQTGELLETKSWHRAGIPKTKIRLNEVARKSKSNNVNLTMTNLLHEIQWATQANQKPAPEQPLVAHFYNATEPEVFVEYDEEEQEEE